MLTMKKVGRKEDGDLFKDLEILLQTVSDLRGESLIPSGVYRFKTFEEADRWMIRTIASTHARLNSKTS